MERHFTVSGFLSTSGRTALHWHRIGKWLPAGGHIEEHEDPVQAVLREVFEETGIEAEVLSTVSAYPHSQPVQIPPPVTIGIYDLSADSHSVGAHQHIDFVYFTVPAFSSQPDLPDDGHKWQWVDEATLRERAVLRTPSEGASRGGQEWPIEEDVRQLALASIEASRLRHSDGAS